MKIRAQWKCHASMWNECLAMAHWKKRLLHAHLHRSQWHKWMQHCPSLCFSGTIQYFTLNRPAVHIRTQHVIKIQQINRLRPLTSNNCECASKELPAGSGTQTNPNQIIDSALIACVILSEISASLEYTEYTVVERLALCWLSNASNKLHLIRKMFKIVHHNEIAVVLRWDAQKMVPSQQTNSFWTAEFDSNKKRCVLYFPPAIKFYHFAACHSLAFFLVHLFSLSSQTNFN